MTKTLADLTPEQRANCIGMWCEYPNTYDHLGIIYGLDNENDPWILRFDVRTEILGYDAKNIIPRFDLPRAWTPNGTPPAGEWQTAKAKIIPNENAKYDPALNVITGDAVADPDHEPRSSHDIRRWIGNWEQA
ncbi:hypothetical protein [Corynebacterium striatum]|uniref:hypothetical protein n=1 Tax=Corynebacterium striatum TaxID=43770 RepID=UPI0027B96F8E|nr:hypothetical protein [Corynebacterium striatum]